MPLAWRHRARSSGQGSGTCCSGDPVRQHGLHGRWQAPGLRVLGQGGHRSVQRAAFGRVSCVAVGLRTVHVSALARLY